MNPPAEIQLDLNLLKALVETPGLPGREGRVADLIEKLAPPDWERWRDPIGNLCLRRPGMGKKILFIAHMDEVGLIVRRIHDDGFLMVDRLGGISLRALPGKRLSLWTENGKLPAWVGLPPAHLDDKTILDIYNIFIDIGAKDGLEAERMGVGVGDGLTWESSFELFGEKFLCAKALDDRCGCFILLQMAHSISATNIPNDVDISLGFVVQEEIGLKGGMPVVNKINPDLVIGVDGTLATDTPDLSSRLSDISLGKGPALKLMDVIRGAGTCYVPNQELINRFRKIAALHNIPLQNEVVAGISTALTPMSYQNNGISTAAISIPIRYHHSSGEMIHLDDIRNTLTLLLKIVSSGME